MSKYLAGHKLWKIIRTTDGYYYEIKLKGIIIDHARIEEPTLSYLKMEGLI